MQPKPAAVELGQVWALYPVEFSGEWTVESVTYSAGHNVVAFRGGGWAYADDMLDNKVGWTCLRR